MTASNQNHPSTEGPASPSKRRYAQQFGLARPLEARVRALLHLGKLPPGDLHQFELVERSQRAVLLHQAAQYGPVFKVVAYGKVWVCVVGLALGRKLLREHADALTPITIDIESMVAGGFIRHMGGDQHQTYRTRLTRALARQDIAAQTPIFEQIASQRLMHFANEQHAAQYPAAAYKKTLESVITGMMIHIVFGAMPNSEFFTELLHGFDALGPHGSAWNQGERQQRAFAEIRRLVLQRCDRSRQEVVSFRGLLAQLVQAGELDDTMLGNLIYMVEMGRDDATGLLRWLSRYACHRPDLIDAIASGADADGRMAQAMILETLRTDQSSRLLRMVERTIRFESFVIPKNTLLRICLWESHRAHDVFASPFEHLPERFVEADYRGDQFAPFGLDKHHCPFSGVTIIIASAFLRALARDFRVSAWRDDEPIMGPYFWEPAREFAVSLAPRQPAR